jgi:hypothetical protein
MIQENFCYICHKRQFRVRWVAMLRCPSTRFLVFSHRTCFREATFAGFCCIRAHCRRVSLCFYIENAIGQFFCSYLLYSRTLSTCFPVFLHRTCHWKATFAVFFCIRVHRHRFATAWKAIFIATCNNVTGQKHSVLGMCVSINKHSSFDTFC